MFVWPANELNEPFTYTPSASARSTAERLPASPERLSSRYRSVRSRLVGGSHRLVQRGELRVGERVALHAAFHDGDEHVGVGLHVAARQVPHGARHVHHVDARVVAGAELRLRRVEQVAQLPVLVVPVHEVPLRRVRVVAHVAARLLVEHGSRVLEERVGHERVHLHALARSGHAEDPHVRGLRLVGVDEDLLARHLVHAQAVGLCRVVAHVLRRERHERGGLGVGERAVLLRQARGREGQRAHESLLLLQRQLGDLERPSGALVHHEVGVSLDVGERLAVNRDEPLEPRYLLVLVADEVQKLTALHLPVLHRGG